MVDFEEMFGLKEPQLAENQESEHVSYGEKLGDSCCGMGFGFVLFFGMLGLSAWNEFRNVANIKTINAARDEYVVGTCSPIMSELEGELVHISCPVSNLDVLGGSDPVLAGISEKDRTGLSLQSLTEVYQWRQQSTTTTKEDKVGGGSTQTTTYTYRRSWSFTTPPSVNNFFNQGESCKTQNNGYACLNWDPATVEPWWQTSSYALGTQRLDQSDAPKAGDYFIPKDKLSYLGEPTVLTPSCGSSSSSSSSTSTSAPNSSNSNRDLQSSGTLLSCSPGGEAALKGNKMYWQQKDSNNDMIDYMSRSYSIRTADMVSILAQQKGNSFAS